MYRREYATQNTEPFRVPENYAGCAFCDPPQEEPTEPLKVSAKPEPPTPPTPPPPQDTPAATTNPWEREEKKEGSRLAGVEKSLRQMGQKAAEVFSPSGVLHVGKEELILLALILFLLLSDNKDLVCIGLLIVLFFIR